MVLYIAESGFNVKHYCECERVCEESNYVVYNYRLDRSVISISIPIIDALYYYDIKERQRYRPDIPFLFT